MISQSVRALIEKEDTVLLLKVTEGNKDYYVIPGGKKKKGETLEETLKREVLEETNIDIKVVKKLEEIDASYEDIQKTQLLYLCEYENGIPILNESPELIKMQKDPTFKCVPDFYKISQVINHKISPSILENTFKKHLKNLQKIKI